MLPTSRNAVVEQLLADVAFGDADHARLKDLHARLAPELDAIARRLFDQLTARSAATTPVAAEQAAELCNALVDWLIAGLTGPHDAHFGEQGWSLAAWHAAARLPPRHAITAINALRADYHQRIGELYEPREGRLVAQSIDKLLDTELALAIHDQLDATAERLERERGAQAERLAAMQTLSAGLAHEVRNPLNSASLQLELLERRLRRAEAAPTLIEPLEQVSHEIERLTRLLNEFLAFARPSDLLLTEHDVPSIVRDVIAAQHSFAAARGVAIQVTGVESLRARIDAPKLRQIAQNLVRNAIEAVEPGGHVAVHVTADDTRVRLVVEDDGPGIAEAIQRRIYEPFFTTKQTGTGLGLAIVHGMVTAHGGTITLDSAPGKTRFEVALPRRPWARGSVSEL